MCFMVVNNCFSLVSRQIHYEQEIIGYSNDQGKNWIAVEEKKTIIDRDRLLHHSCSFSSSSAPLFLLTSHYKVSIAPDDGSIILFVLSLLLFLSFPFFSFLFFSFLFFSFQVIPCDFAVSATGVIPNTEFLLRSSDSHCPLAMDEEGYLIVDDYFRCCSSSSSSISHPVIENIFSAGDCCVYRPQFRPTEFFFQMKLWTQVMKIIMIVIVIVIIIVIISYYYCYCY
jgi:hypothetical protein